jgi:hypothetical protein
LGPNTSFVKADNVYFPSNIHPRTVSIYRYRITVYSYLCGLMQKIFFFFKRERAKLVPIVSVAGRAGGTTIVIKSNALTTIRCHES